MKQNLNIKEVHRYTLIDSPKVSKERECIAVLNIPFRRSIFSVKRFPDTKELLLVLLHLYRADNPPPTSSQPSNGGGDKLLIELLTKEDLC